MPIDCGATQLDSPTLVHKITFVLEDRSGSKVCRICVNTWLPAVWTQERMDAIITMARQPQTITPDRQPAHTFEFDALERNPSGHFGYLHHVVQFAERPDLLLTSRQRYDGRLSFGRLQLADLVPSGFQALIAPPSRRPELRQPWIDSIKAKHHHLADLSDRFSRNDEARAGEGQDVFKGLEYAAQSDEPSFKALLIVDDVIHTGGTAWCVREKMLQSGLSKDCRFFIVAPLFFLRQDRKPADAQSA